MNTDLITSISKIKIPIVIISYHNHKYVDNTIRQLLKIDSTLLESIIIMDNHSTDLDTIQYLDTNVYNVLIVRNKKNNGPRIYENLELFDILPERFIITDPDLEYHQELPINFIDILNEILDKYPTQKVGFAISIEDHAYFYQYGNYLNNMTIYEWESKFWSSDIKEDFNSNYNKTLPLYHSKLDTTFALYAKSRMITTGEEQWDGIRVGGCFTCRHLPFYINDPIMSIEDRYIHHSKSKFSTTSKFILQYIEENYVIENNNETLSFTKK